MTEPVAVDLRDFVAFDTQHAVRARVYATELLAVDLLCLEPGQQLAARTYEESDAVYTVIGGRAWVITDTGEVTLEPLQALLVPVGVAHGIRNDSPDPLLLQIVTSLPVPAQTSRASISKDPLTDPDPKANRSSPA